MKLLLNINQYEYKEFLHSNVDILIIGIKDFSSGYLKTYDLNELKTIIDTIHKNNKLVYLAMNIIANEETINNLTINIELIKSFQADGYVIADFGFLQLLKEHNLIDKIIFNPVTNITNKYSTLIANNLGINHACLANELNIKDILEIANYTKGNIEILAQGYYQICNSKRPLLSNFFKNFKIKNTSDYYYIKEESRDYAYPIIELNNEVLIYIDKQRCTLKYIREILDSKIEYLRIDTIFLSKEEIFLHVDNYSKLITNTISSEEAMQKISKTNSNLESLDNISILKKEKNNE